MLEYYKLRNQYTLWKFFIDDRYQNKGYGKQTLKLAIDYLINTLKKYIPAFTKEMKLPDTYIFSSVSGKQEILNTIWKN